MSPPAWRRSSLHHHDWLEVAGSRWPIRFVASETFLASHQRWGSWILLAGGFMLSDVMAGYVFTLRTRTAQIEQTVQERTAELQASEQRLRRTEQQVAGLVNHVEGIVREVDARTLTYTFVSQQAERLLGYPLKRWLNEPTFWQDHLHSDDREASIQYCLSAVRRGEPHDFEYRMIAAAGREVWLRDLVTLEMKDGEAVLLRGIMVDITGRKQSETALQLSEERLKACIGNTPNMAVQWYAEQGRVLFWNPASERVFGWTSEEAVGRKLDQLIHTPEEAAAFIQLLGVMKVTGQPVRPTEFQFRRRDGSQGTCLSNGANFRHGSTEANKGNEGADCCSGVD